MRLIGPQTRVTRPRQLPKRTFPEPLAPDTCPGQGPIDSLAGLHLHRHGAIEQVWVHTGAVQGRR